MTRFFFSSRKKTNAKGHTGWKWQTIRKWIFSFVARESFFHVIKSVQQQQYRRSTIFLRERYIVLCLRVPPAYQTELPYLPRLARPTLALIFHPWLFTRFTYVHPSSLFRSFSLFQYEFAATTDCLIIRPSDLFSLDDSTRDCQRIMFNSEIWLISSCCEVKTNVSFEKDVRWMFLWINFCKK